MSPDDNRFLLIGLTRPEITDGEALRITSLLESGRVDVVHLRHPGASFEEVESVLDGIPVDLLHRITLHTHTGLSMRYPVGGVHLKFCDKDATESDRSSGNPCIAEEYKQSGGHRRISRSCHSLNEIDLCADCDYVFLSPIFDSLSKRGYRSNFPEEKLPGLSDFLRRSRIPVIALGGVTEDKIPLLKDLHFYGAAMLGALWSETL